MRRILLALLLVCSAGLNAMTPKTGSTAVGASFGIPTGMNFKSWFSDKAGLNINFGVDPVRSWLLFMNFDVLAHFDVIYNAPFFAGGGLLMTVDAASSSRDNYDIGLRAVAGEEFFLKNAPVSFFIEGGGILFPGLRSDFPWVRVKGTGWTAAAGVRYYMTER